MTRTPVQILLLGSTGSIGQNTLNCVRRHPGRFAIAGLAALRSHSRIVEQAREFGARWVALGEEPAAREARVLLGSGTDVAGGARAATELAESADYDIMVNALVGSVGLAPTLAALHRGKRVALANKESLVVGGGLIQSLLSAGSGSLVPIDSEHSAVLQCLSGEERGAVESIVLTASGGPFRELPLERFATITPADALKHPTWSMGHKITIDSATLVNKGFEIIEAHHLFGLDYDHLRVWIHPQSIIHSLVEFHDGAVMAQLGLPDMEIPIQYALEYPTRLPIRGRRLDLTEIGSLSFSQPDMQRFPCLRLCIEAGRAGGAATVVLNAANEVAVHEFLNGSVPFTAIPQILQDALAWNQATDVATLEAVLNTDTATRRYVRQHLEHYRP